LPTSRLSSPAIGRYRLSAHGEKTEQSSTNPNISPMRLPLISQESGHPSPLNPYFLHPTPSTHFSRPLFSSVSFACPVLPTPNFRGLLLLLSVFLRNRAQTLSIISLSRLQDKGEFQPYSRRCHRAYEAVTRLGPFCSFHPFGGVEPFLFSPHLMSDHQQNKGCQSQAIKTLPQLRV